MSHTIVACPRSATCYARGLHVRRGTTLRLYVRSDGMVFVHAATCLDHTWHGILSPVASRATSLERSSWVASLSTFRVPPILIVVNMATIVVSGLLALCLPRLTVTPKPRTYRVGTLVLCAVTTAVLCFFALPVPIWPLVCISLPLAVLSFCVLSVAWVAALRSRVAENGAMLFADIAIGYVLSFCRDAARRGRHHGLRPSQGTASFGFWRKLVPLAAVSADGHADACNTGHEGRQDIAIAMPAALLPLMTVGPACLRGARRLLCSCRQR